MARDFQINGECLVTVKGAAGSGIATLQELGLAADPITVTPVFKHKDINVDAWGEAPAEVQWMLAEVFINMTLIHFDQSILDICIRESMAGAAAIGQMKRAGARMGNNTARFNASNHYVGLNLSSPVQGKPWRFFFTYMPSSPLVVPLGVEKKIIQVGWRCIPYTQDPYGSGTGAENYQLWDHSADS